MATKSNSSFNTDDGIRRAAMCRRKRSLPRRAVRFNTDDGIGRAAISKKSIKAVSALKVSIPMTVLGGLQSER